MKISNLVWERLIKILYSIVALFIGARFLSKNDFLLLQQIVLFQSVLVFLINLPYSSIILRLAQDKLSFVNEIYGITIFIRLLLTIVSICSFGIYLHVSLFQTEEIFLILFGLLPSFISLIFLTDIIPHIFNFEGKKNWRLVYISLFFLFIKVSIFFVFKSIFVKSIIETFEALIVLIWCYKTYLFNAKNWNLSLSIIRKVKKLSLLSSGLYFNGIFSVFIIRVDQLILTSHIDKNNLSNYMLVGSIVGLFMIPLNVFGERTSFLLNNSKSKSFIVFQADSRKNIVLFLLMGLILYVLYVVLFEKISLLVFNRDLSYLFVPGCILGLSIIVNALGMVLGQINTIMNGGFFTLIRTALGSLAIMFFISVGYNLLGIKGVSISSMICLFFTNNLFWLFSSKIRKVLLAK